ncbi:hypothetical protein [Mangrovimonas aestuarii]|uniref:hypothetical protein n=1 Tax=Mangrovimonas aestuarii TaxID=3018443 RepID=UPI002378D727|nr:hypothetical protein [Mangrovimonas aestuarii]
MKTLDSGLLNVITSKICNFKKLDNIQFLEQESNEDYKCFKLSYYTEFEGFHVCRVEIDLKKEKLSIGLDGDSFLGTFKFSNSNLSSDSFEACTCETQEPSLFC